VIKFRAKELRSLFHLKAGAMIYFVMFFIVFAALPFVKYDFSFAKNFLLLCRLFGKKEEWIDMGIRGKRTYFCSVCC